MPGLEAPLAGRSEEEYGDKYQEHLLEQYKLLVQSALTTSERRGGMNTFLLSVNTVLASTVGVLFGVSTTTCWHVTLPICGIVISVAWLFMIRSYKDLNAAKYRVIHRLEDALPARVFEREWDDLVKGSYREPTNIEPWVPGVFLILYAVAVVSIVTPCIRAWFR